MVRVRVRVRYSMCIHVYTGVDVKTVDELSTINYPPSETFSMCLFSAKQTSVLDLAFCTRSSTLLYVNFNH